MLNLKINKMKKVKCFLIILLIFSAFMTAFSQDAEDYFSLGFNEFIEGNYAKAIEYFTMEINIDPNNTVAYRFRGDAYNDLQKYDEAISDYTKAISIDPDNAKAYYNRGFILNDLQRYIEAISDFTIAISKDPNYAAAYFNRGLAYEKIGDCSKAIEDWFKLIELDPYDESTLQELINRCN